MLFSLRKATGLALYFLGLGLWFVIALGALCWALLFGLPTVCLIFLAGYCTGTFQRRDPWPDFTHWRGWDWVRRSHLRLRFQGLHQIGDGERVIWAVYPHGHFAISALFGWALNPTQFPDTRPAVHSGIFWLPIFGSLAGWINAIDVTERAMTHTLIKENKSLIMCPGGVQEIGMIHNEFVRRRGFLRIAHQTQTTVVPVWCPDERSYYRQWLPLGTLLKPLLYFPFPMLLWGAWWCPLVPRRLSGRSRILIGKPVRWDQGAKSPEQGEKEFYTELRKLIDSSIHEYV